MIDKIKSLASDTMLYGFFQIIGRFLTFLLTPLYTNYLTKVELGETTYIYSIIAFLNILFSFGIESSFFRFYDKNDIEQSKRVFTNAMIIIGTIAGAVAISVIATADLFAASFVELDNAALIIRLSVLIPFFDSLVFIPYAFLRMTRNGKKFAMTRFVLIIIAVINNFILVVFLRTGAMGVILSQLIASSIGIIIVGKEFRNNFNFRIDFKLIKEMIIFGLPTLPANLAAMILQVADRPFLKAFASVKDLAIYSVNYKLAIPMMIIVTVFDYAWKPFYMSHHNEKGSKELFARIFTYFTLISSGIFLATSFFIEFAVRMPFIGGRFVQPDYWVGLGILPLVLGGFFFNGAQSHFAAGFLITKNTKYIPMAVGSAAIVSMALNFILIPHYTYWGSAIAILVGYFIGAVTLYVLQRKVYPIDYEWKRVGIIVGLTLAVYFSTIQLTSGLELYVSFSIRFVALFVYIFLLFITGFFSKSELGRLKSMLVRNKKV